jgi:DNA-binding IclR family transcriptional regulator
MHDREQLYRKMWDNHTNRYGVLQGTQQDVAKQLGIPYQRLSLIMSEFIKLGYIKKSGHSFQLREPQRLDWSDDFKRRRLTT